MGRFQQMQVYVAVAEEQGFAAAARRLEVSPPAVTRIISALEARLGVQLLNRTTRCVRATEAGLRYLEDARRILELADAADEAAAGINAEPSGHLTVTAPALFGRLFIMPVINEYLAQFPGVDVDAIFLDRPTNLVEEGIDVAIRIGELPDSSMRALRVGTVRHITCASPAYLAHAGSPDSPAQLKGHALVVSTAGGFAPGWRYRDKGCEITVPVKARVSATTNDAAIEATVGGMGVTRLLSYQVASLIEQGELVEVLQGFAPPPLPVHVLHREGPRGSAKVRSFIDLAGERLKGNPTIN